MAHEYLLRFSGATVADAWAYADAMQAEADKRNPKEPRETHKNLAEFTMHPEYDASINYPPDAWVMYKGEKRLAVSIDIKKEWQPDWSQAPADACCWFIGGKSWDVKPYWSKYIPCYKNEETQTTWQGDGMIEAPSFGYTGNWRNSLRKRPK